MSEKISPQIVNNLSHLSRQVLSEVSQEFRKENKFSDESLRQLYNIFGSVLEEALELYESKKVVKITEKPDVENPNLRSEDVRWLLQITDTNASGDIHVLYPDVNFCNCTEFRKHVLKNQAVTCKHVLAAWLASLDTEKLGSQELSSTLFRDLLKL